jgi:hypothetical protein
LGSPSPLGILLDRQQALYLDRPEATPTVTVGDVWPAHGYHSLAAQIAFATFDGAQSPTGYFAYAIDGNVIPGCDSLYINDTCGDSYTPRDLTAGTYTVTVTYTPDDFGALLLPAHERLHADDRNSLLHPGTVFNDLDFDKVQDGTARHGWLVHGCQQLHQRACAGRVDRSRWQVLHRPAATWLALLHFH